MRKATGTVEYRPGRNGAPGRWWCRITCVDGSRPWLDLGAWPNSPQGRERAKEAAAAATERARELGAVSLPRRIGVASYSGAGETVEEYAVRWLKDRERRGLSSVASDRGRLEKHVLPLLKERPIAAVGPNDLRAVVEHLDEIVRRDALHWNTARKIWGLVTKMFSDAVRSKVASLRVRQDNPARDVLGPDDGEPTAKQWLYPNEAATLLACNEVPIRWRRLYALAIYLYLRPGELAALEWKDVNLAARYVHVHQAMDQRTGRIKATKTGVTRKVPIRRALRPLLVCLKSEAPSSGRVVRSDSPKRGEAMQEHGMPPLEDLAATLRDHLKRAGVNRAELHEERRTTKRVTFYDLRSTGITWEVLAGTKHLKIQRRAGHKAFSTTEGYIRSAEELGASIGAPFPPLPEPLTQSSGESSPADDSNHDRASKKRKRVASPTGFESDEAVGPRAIEAVSRPEPGTATVLGTPRADRIVATGGQNSDPSDDDVREAARTAIADGRLGDAQALLVELARREALRTVAAKPKRGGGKLRRIK